MSNTNFLQALLTAQVAPSTIAPAELPVINLHADNDYTLRANGTYLQAGEHIITVDELAKHARVIDELREDVPAPVRVLRFDDSEGGVLTLHAPHHGIETGFAMRDHALDQVCERLSVVHGAPIGRYLKAWDTKNQFSLLNRHITQYAANTSAPRHWLVRTFKGVSRAVLSTGYATISTTKLFNEFQALTHGQNLPELQVAPQSYVSPDSMRLDTVWRNITPSNGPEGGYGVGISFSNSYIGTGAFQAACLLWRGKCRNSILVDLNESSLRMVHKGKSAEYFAVASMRAFINAMIEKSGAVAERMAAAENAPINVPDWSALFDAALPGANKLTDKERDNALIGTEGAQTFGALLNGLTFAAHQTVGMSDARSMELQRAAGALLMQDQHRTLNMINRVAAKATA